MIPIEEGIILSGSRTYEAKYKILLKDIKKNSHQGGARQVNRLQLTI